jgi:hypothetical protein
MKPIFALLLAVGVIAGDIASAEAAVCARGVHRAGCVGARGGVVVHRHPVYRPHRHCVFRNGVRVCRY